MSRKRTTFIFALLAVIGTVVIAGCGGGSSSSSSEPSSGEPAAETTGAGGSGTIAGSEISGLGTVLVDAEGMTVYEFTEDKGTTSNCYGECEAAWPPVEASGKPPAGEGAMSADLGTTKRKDGTLQVTYKGHPLYTFTGDQAAGEANGSELDGTWFALSESGSAVKGKASAAPAESESEPAAEEETEEGGGAGYGY
jgi:predicted lipoprotein with Yx(FWY)xxD motif